MVSAKIMIRNPQGLHLRPAGVLCTEALKYTCKIEFKKGDLSVNGKSVLGVLALRIHEGDEFEIACTGEDEMVALSGLETAINQGLGEDF